MTNKNDQKPIRPPVDFDPTATNWVSQLGAYMELPISWFRFTKKHSDAVLLAYLCNKWKVLKIAKKLEKGGWFYCTSKTVERDLNMNRHAQARCLKRLELSKFIKRKKGKPPNGYGRGRELRWVKVRRREIHAAVINTILQIEPDWKWLEKHEKSKKHKTGGRFRRESA